MFSRIRKKIGLSITRWMSGKSSQEATFEKNWKKIKRIREKKAPSFTAKERQPGEFEIEVKERREKERKEIEEKEREESVRKCKAFLSQISGVLLKNQFAYKNYRQIEKNEGLRAAILAGNDYWNSGHFGCCFFSAHGKHGKQETAKFVHALLELKELDVTRVKVETMNWIKTSSNSDNYSRTYYALASGIFSVKYFEMYQEGDRRAAWRLACDGG